MATREKSPIENVKNRKTYNAVDSIDQLLFIEVSGNMLGGYRQDLLVSPLNVVEKEFFVCHECKGLMRNACQIGEEQTPVCEVCVTEGVSSHPMMRSRKMIPELQTKCPLATRGCVWNGMVCGVQEHLNVCPKVVVKCKNTCGVILPRKELEEHLKHLCMKRIVECDHCHFFLIYKVLLQHCDVCLEVQLSCPNKCDVIVKRKLLSTHIDTDCPNSVVECPYRKFGCEEMMKRCELEDHKRVNEIVHLQSTTLFAVCKMEEMEKKIVSSDIAIQDLKEKVQQMEKTIISSESTIQNLQCDIFCSNSKIQELKETQITIQFEGDKLCGKVSNELEDKVISITKALEKLSYPIVLRDFIPKDAFPRVPHFIAAELCFYVTWRVYNLRLSLQNLNTFNPSVSVTIMMDSSTKTPLVIPLFEGRFKLTLIDRFDKHESLVYESAVVKLRPKRESVSKTKDTYPDNLVLAKMPRDIFFADRLVTENGVAFTLQIQEGK